MGPSKQRVRTRDVRTLSPGNARRMRRRQMEDVGSIECPDCGDDLTLLSNHTCRSPQSVVRSRRTVTTDKRTEGNEMAEHESEPKGNDTQVNQCSPSCVRPAHFTLDELWTLHWALLREVNSELATNYDRDVLAKVKRLIASEPLDGEDSSAGRTPRRSSTRR